MNRRGDSERGLGVFEEFDARLRETGYVPIPVGDEKKPASKGWTKSASLTEEQILRQRRKFANSNIGLLAGTPLSTGRFLNFIDTDHDGLAPFVRAVMTPFASGKVGSKGETIFAQGEPGLKSGKIKRVGHSTPLVEFFCDNGMVVIPPSVHPTAGRYRWVNKSLFEVRHDELPILNAERMAIMEHVATNEHAWAIIEWGANVKAHDAMLKLASSGVANLTDDLPWLASCLNALFHADYRGNTKNQTLEMLQSARAKGLGATATAVTYDPGVVGPIPLGYTREGNYALRDQVRRIIIVASAGQLLNLQFLLGLAPSTFWAERFKSKKRFNTLLAGETLIAACKAAGPFNPLNVRGRGIWREGERIVENLGGPIPPGVEHLYLCFSPIQFERSAKFETERLFEASPAVQLAPPARPLLGFLGLGRHGAGLELVLLLVGQGALHHQLSEGRHPLFFGIAIRKTASSDREICRTDRMLIDEIHRRHIGDGLDDRLVPWAGDCALAGGSDSMML
jgi:hypothetical protein